LPTNNLDKVKQFLERQMLLKLTQKEIENLSEATGSIDISKF
jgi:hypothetical protein